MKEEKINYQTCEIAGVTTRDQRRWQAFVQCCGTVDDTKYTKIVAELANRTAEDVGYVRSVEKRTLVNLLRQGYVVSVGDMTYKPVCRGAFSAPDAPFTLGVHKLEIAAIPRGELKNCLAGLTPVNLEKGPQPLLQSVIDAQTGLENVLVVGHTVYLAGRNLAPDATRPDETAVLLGDDGAVAATGTISDSTLQTVNVAFATWPEPGVYQLCLSTRSGMPEEYTLATVRRDVTVVAAETKVEG